MKAEREILNPPVVKGSTKSKALGRDAQGIQKTMRPHHYLGDGVAQVALNSISGLIGMLTYFYTDKIGIAAATVGTIMLITKFINAIADLLMGRIVDATKSKYGKARPWFLWMALPAMASIILLFTVPAEASSTVKTFYALATVAFASAIVYTGIAIPFGSMISIRTKSVEERGKMGLTRTIFGYIIGMIISIALIPITNMLGGNQKAWIIVAVVLGMVSFLSLILTFLASKENNAGVSIVESDNIPFWESIKLLFQNKYWVIMLFAQLLINMLYTLNGSTGIYYTKYILGNEDLIGVMGAVGLVPVFLGFVMVGPMIKKFGLTRTARIGMILGIVSSLIRCFMPYNFIAALVLGGIATLATIPMMAVGGVLVNNTVEYGEWKTGKRLVGMVNSANSFGVKIGMGLAAAMIGWVLAMGSYDGTLATQASSAITSILVLTVYLPLVIFVLTYICLRKYDLDEKYPQIVKELEERSNS
ncbi:glycoside-pentoside-hexuronide (GPH):cation symporter [Paenibacillus polysaccharolyticus]|uniref:MFS transporter n=1 Tax=Paenibacillus polysaccharolyticus TaxID=582692 RepID=UPI0020A1C176|nr:glycoside-pentoside-hexuronide (GPH):cation symporter [Paenibacillus polysaccharolyticus]MCP1133635.1 glycoside-pentoside-hexuronide (GPH):cation symporter [Paenibacillus polysaccharolyticus]